MEQKKDDVPYPVDLSHQDANGVDVTLIDWMLSLTPTERLEMLQAQARALLELRDAKPTS